MDLVPLSHEVASELLIDSVRGTSRCPRCCTNLNKSVFVDGEGEDCTHCGEALWFEVRGTDVVTHAVDSRITRDAASLSEVLRTRETTEQHPTLPGSPFDDD